MIKLTAREIEVICLVACGQTDDEIAESLCLTNDCVRWHINRIQRKLGLPSRARHGAYASMVKANRVKMAIYALKKRYVTLKSMPTIGG